METLYRIAQKIKTYKDTQLLIALYRDLRENKRARCLLAGILGLFYFVPILAQGGFKINPKALPYFSPLGRMNGPLSHLTTSKPGKEVFGFAPYWNIDKLDNVDLSTLTTFSYFGVPVGGDGTLNTDDFGYQTFMSDKATDIFKKAHAYDTRVVLTLTQMNNPDIIFLMDDPQAQQQAIQQAVQTVASRGIDGVNVDFEYTGDPGPDYRNKFSTFITNLTSAMHTAVPNSQVTVSVYASAIKEPKIYDIAALSKSSDGIFMMAYDFATTIADNAIPTAPLYGYKEGKYWYDVATAVNDFLTQMPADKLILGVPWYGYNYLVYQPTVKAETLPYYTWRGRPTAETYAEAENSITPNMKGATAYRTGWDNAGQVGWKAYYDSENGTWRMIFLDDSKSLGIKYDFAKSKNLAGVGMWALGNDYGHGEMWSVLKDKFGTKIAYNMMENK